MPSRANGIRSVLYLYGVIFAFRAIFSLVSAINANSLVFNDLELKSVAYLWARGFYLTIACWRLGNIGENKKG